VASGCQRRRLAIAKLVLITFDHHCQQISLYSIGFPSRNSHVGHIRPCGNRSPEDFQEDDTKCRAHHDKTEVRGYIQRVPLPLFPESQTLYSYVGVNGVYQLLRLIPTWVLGKESRFVRALVCCCLASSCFLHDVLFGATLRLRL
jgi:hypothetical protein